MIGLSWTHYNDTFYIDIPLNPWKYIQSGNSMEVFTGPFPMLLTNKLKWWNLSPAVSTNKHITPHFFHILSIFSFFPPQNESAFQYFGSNPSS